MYELHRNANLQTLHFIYLFNKCRNWIFETCSILSVFFFSSKCSLFHNAKLFGSYIIHILYTGYAKIKKKKIRRQRVKTLENTFRMWSHNVTQFLLTMKQLRKFICIYCYLFIYYCLLVLYITAKLEISTPQRRLRVWRDSFAPDQAFRRNAIFERSTEQLLQHSQRSPAVASLLCLPPFCIQCSSQIPTKF